MSKYHDEKYDEIKFLLNKSRLIKEQTQINIAKSIEDRIDGEKYRDETSNDSNFDNGSSNDEETPKTKKDKSQKYRISGGILVLHGKGRMDLDITSEDKLAFQETMDEFVDEVSDLVDFNELNVYKNSVEWSGNIIDQNLEFMLKIGESSGVYINGETIKVDDDFLELMDKLKQFYEKFSSKWSKVLATRKKTTTSDDESI